MMPYIYDYLIGINLLTFLIYAWDKRKAIKKKWRISEKTLLLLAVIGGSAGAYLAILFCRHKTKHPKFYLGVPIILFLQIGLACLYFICR